jgi:chromosome segregation ATPase
MELQESLAEHQAVVSEKEALLKHAKKEASKARSQSSAKDKQRMKLEAELDKLQPSVIASSEAISALTKRVAADVKTVSKIEKEKSAHGEKLAELDEEIQEYQDKEEELQKGYDELKDSESGVGSMTEEQEMEYEKIRDAAAVASAVSRRKLQSAVRSLESARAAAAKVVEERKELQGRKDDAERSVGELTARKDTLEKVSRCSVKFQRISVLWYIIVYLFSTSDNYVAHKILFFTKIEPRKDPIRVSYIRIHPYLSSKVRL